MGVLALILELSRSYSTPLGGQWIVHGTSCWARNALGYPCAVNNQLRTGADKGNPTV